MGDMRYLSDEELQEATGSDTALALNTRNTGKRNGGFTVEEWDQILDGRSKILTEDEDFPHLKMLSFRLYAGNELRTRWATDPTMQRPMLRRCVNNPRAIIIDYRKP